jgi:hypothetical protein
VDQQNNHKERNIASPRHEGSKVSLLFNDADNARTINLTDRLVFREVVKGALIECLHSPLIRHVSGQFYA